MTWVDLAGALSANYCNSYIIINVIAADSNSINCDFNSFNLIIECVFDFLS